MVDSHGYLLESHQVETEDGYILTLLRVPDSRDFEEISDKSENPTEKSHDRTRPRPPVLVVHGFQGSSADWLSNSKDKVLPYRLMNEGYDCWLGNLRGSPLSMAHKTIQKGSKSRKFWDFSFHEMSLYDVPAMISYILDTTGNDYLGYVGHSMGCSVFFAAMSLKPEYCSKISAMVALAPAVYADNFPNKAIKYVVAPLATFFGKLRRAREKPAFSKPMSGYAQAACPRFIKNPDKLAGWAARKYGNIFGGIGKNQIDKDRMEKIAGHWPASTSVKTMCHGMQCVFRKAFAQFDYGRSENLKRYGQERPPLYDLSKVTVSVATFHAKDDNLCSSQDVTRLSQDLPNLIGNFGITQPDFTHGDFVFGKDADKLAYDIVVEIFRTHTEVYRKNLDLTEDDDELICVTKL